jgi:hypothetical protein
LGDEMAALEAEALESLGKAIATPKGADVTESQRRLSVILTAAPLSVHVREEKRMRRQIIAVCLCVLAVILSAALINAEEVPDKAYPSEAKLPWIPVGSEWTAGYARGLQIALQYLGHSVDYDTIMGDSGIAFIAQGEEDSTNLFDGAVDVGWWPLDPFGMNIRLNFLEQTVGRRLSYIPADNDSHKADAAAHYAQRFAPAVKQSIAQGRPCLARTGCWFVVSGYDQEELALLGNCTLVDVKELIRIFQQPTALLVLGEPSETMDRKQADLAALRYAVALHRDQVLAATDARATAEWASPLRDREAVGKQWLTGLNTFAAWAKCLRDTEHLGQAQWHANMVRHLLLNRGSAVRYLKTMADRHPEDVAVDLNSAAARYQEVLAALGKADTTGEAISSPSGREALAKLAEQVAVLESQAIQEIEKALAAAS